MARDVQIAGGVGSAPQTYGVPNATEIILRAINATFDGTAAVSSWIPVVEIVSDGGVVIARCPCNTTVAAGGTAECSFYPFNDEATTVAPPAQTLNEVIFANEPWAWWKLDESAGNTAFDSSPNRFDQTVPLGATAPTWGQPAGPPGTQSALFFDGGAETVQDAGFAPLAGDFTALGWINRQTLQTTFMFGQGDPTASHTGWSLGIEASNQGSGNRATIFWGDNVTIHGFEGDNPLLANVWHFLAVTHSAGVFQLYVDGALQTGSSGGGYTAAGGVWTARTPSGGLESDVTLSYLVIYTHALTAGEIAAIFLAA